MADFKVGDDFAFHAKAVAAGNAAIGVWVRAGAWCALYQPSDGFIPDHVIAIIATPVQRSRLVAVGLWAEVDGGCRFHQWASHQRPDYRPRIPEAVRTAVYARDSYACVACGATEPLSLDHIWPWSLGGEDTVENFQTLCIPCNCRKGARV